MSRKNRPDAAPREEFCLVGQAFHGSVSNTRVELIVDSNVVSRAESVMQKGFVERDIQHRRLRNLCQWARSGDVEFNCYVGGVEGAGFDGFSVSSYSLARRLASSTALFRAAMNDWSVDPFDGTPLNGRILVKLPDIKSAVDSAQEVAGTLFLPNYIAILLWRQLCAGQPSRRDAQTSRTLLLELGRRLETSINFIPLSWIMLFYAEFGTPDVARTVRTGLFKLDGSSVAKNSRSGGWDMSLLSYMSMLRLVDQHEKVVAPRMPVLVTDDEQFARAAAMVTAVGNTALFEVDFGRLRPDTHAIVSGAILEHSSRRLLCSPTVPVWSELIGVANQLEQQLGFDKRDQLCSDRPILEISADPARMQRLLAILPLPREEIVRRVHDEPVDLFTALFLAMVVMSFFADQQERDELLRAAAKHAAPGYTGDPALSSGAELILETVALIEAWCRTDEAIIQVYLERLDLTSVVHRNIILLLTLLVVKSLVELLADREYVPLERAYARMSEIIAERDV